MLEEDIRHCDQLGFTLNSYRSDLDLRYQFDTDMSI
jgi:hypothetical protein